MHHALLVASEVVGEVVLVLLDGLGQPTNVAVTEDAPNAGEERLRLTVTLDVLIDQVSNEGLASSQSHCRHDRPPFSEWCTSSLLGVVHRCVDGCDIRSAAVVLVKDLAETGRVCVTRNIYHVNVAYNAT